jgi:c-di-AMP phosphodiesterase-like protein
MDKYIILTQSDSLDGAFATTMLKSVLINLNKKVKVFSFSPSEPFPSDMFQIIKNKNVVVVDICWDADIMKWLMLFSKKFIVIDHHKSNENVVKSKLYTHIFDVTKATCELMCEYLEILPYPDIIKIIADQTLIRENNNDFEKEKLIVSILEKQNYATDYEKTDEIMYYSYEEIYTKFL